MLGKKRSNLINTSLEKTVMRKCLECKQDIFSFEPLIIHCKNLWKIKNNIPIAKPKGYKTVPNLDLDYFSSFTNLAKQMGSLDLRDNYALKRPCLICKCNFVIQTDEENWKKKCLNCFKIQSLCVPIDIEFEFFQKFA
jgi:hypothetical protein